MSMYITVSVNNGKSVVSVHLIVQVPMTLLGHYFH